MELTCACCGAELPTKPAISGRDRLIGTPGEFSVLVCKQCGSGTTLPKVEEHELAQFYPSEYSPHVDAPPPSGVLASMKLRLRDYFERRAMGRMPFVALQGRTGELLDVGCGRGDLGASFIARGWNVTGVEPSPQACESARAKGLDAHNGTLGTVELKREHFDAMTFQHSLEHVYDPRIDLKIVHDLLRPGGQLLVSVPNFGSLQRKIFCGRWFHLDLPRHRFHYTPEGLSKTVSTAGLKVERVSTATSVMGLSGSLTYVFFGRWVFDNGPWATRLITYVSFALLPIALLLTRFGGGDYLHLVASKPERTES